MSNGPETILFVEDDEEIARLVRDMLTKECYGVMALSDGEQLSAALLRSSPDLIILDLMLPGEDGLSICRRVRSNSQVPILMLTAKIDDIDRILGLEMGADDYLCKPFHPRELLARIKAILRRTRGQTTSSGRQRKAFSSFIIDLDARALQTSAGVSVPLTSAEFDLLACFILRPRRVLTRDQLLDWTRGRVADPLDRTIDMSISRLRKKLEAVAPDEQFITTVRNSGYLFVPAITPCS